MAKYENLLNDRIDNPDVVLYNVSDIQRIFQIGRTSAYRLMSAKGFPSIRLNNRLYVSKERLKAWSDKYTGKEFVY